MANNSNKNLDAETSKFFIDSDEARGVNPFEAASLDIPQTARPDSSSPLAKKFAEQEDEAKGPSNTRFTPTPRPEPKADKSVAEIQAQKVPRNAWICCICEVTNPLVGPACWQCKSHYACTRCYSA
ncbi:hypothetical protein INS49_001290 [Diaporthe citri]|uniref:uncharacterized protein n=1 Tax=Diaporthe citri TaxID=83186 RepID=UPI001C825DD0|nr:uncharacterized protein INS49_001290 [Diaporthe citri]KAG6367108.1 hypothetical protein INS49_001290 [Diaporthe citri]